MAGLPFTQIKAEDCDHILLNSGVILKGEFDLAKGTYQHEQIIGITTSNISFESGAEYIDFAEDMNNVPAKTKEFKRLKSYAPKLSGTFVTADNELGKMLLAAADIQNDTAIIPRSYLKLEDFNDIWFVADYSATVGGFVAIKLMNVINTDGFKLQTQKDGKGTFSFVFEGHYSTDNIDTPPFEIHIKKGSEIDTTNAA